MLPCLFRPFSLTTSSIVVTPSFTLRSPLCRSVIMPSSIALRRSSRPDAPTRISSLQLLADLHHLVEADAALVAGVCCSGRSRRPSSASRRWRPPAVKPAVHQRLRRHRVAAPCSSTQMRRTRRCAQIRCTELATRNGSMPMFISRLIVLGASLVCSVESTRWPVSAALTAISAVSKSRISPTRMMFGILAEERAQRRREVQADVLLDLDLVDAGEVELDRVLRGHDVGFGRVDLRDRRVERVGLAAAGRAGHEHHAPRARESRCSNLASDSARTRASSCRASACPCRADACTIFSPKSVGRHRDAEVDLLRLAALVEADLDAAVLRQALLGDVELRHDLDARRRSRRDTSSAAP